MINKFEFFCILFYMFDSVWDETKNEQLGSFLSSMNPFLWTNESSANPSYYEEYEEFIGSFDITLNNSLELAQQYITHFSEHFDNSFLQDAFEKYDKTKWREKVVKFIQNPHKGGEARDIEEEK